MIKTNPPDIPWHDKYRDPSKFKDSKDFVDGYNQCLKDLDVLIGTAKRPNENDWREAGITGGNQIHTICEKWRLEFND